MRKRANKSTYLTAYNKLEGGEIVKYAGPDIKASSESEAMVKYYKGKRRRGLPLHIEGRLISRHKR